MAVMRTDEAAVGARPGTGSGPWAGDVVGLVEAYRSGAHTVGAEIEATLAAVGRSGLGAICHVDADRARAAASAAANLSLPLAGVPFAVKELEQVAGWPLADASVPLRHRRADRTSTQVTRLIAAGAIPVVQATSSEMARGTVTASPLHGITRNPWDLARSSGGSSGGSAAVVAGGIVPLATATDGGGSTRQPAAFTGLPGLKVTWRLIPSGPLPIIEPLTVVTTALTRSIRDLALVLDATVGFDARDPFSTATPEAPAFVAGLGHTQVSGLRVAWMPTLGGQVDDPAVSAQVKPLYDELVAAAGLEQVTLEAPTAPAHDGSFAAIASLRIYRWLHPYWPDCADALTPDIRAVMASISELDPRVMAGLDDYRFAVIDFMAALFEQVDLIALPSVAAEAFAADPAELEAGAGSPPAAMPLANVSGCPAISLPAGLGAAGLPLGLQIFARHHHDAELLELGRLVEALQPWPLIAPGGPW